LTKKVLFGNGLSPRAYSLFHEFISYFSDAISSSVWTYSLSFFTKHFN